MSKVKNNDIFHIENILATFKTYWYWFVISVIICMACANIYIKTKSPVFNRSAQVLIKQDDNKYPNADIGSFTGFDFLNKASNLWDEFQILQSPDIMAEVVTTLSLNKSFVEKRGLKNISLYADSIPVDVNLADFDPDQSLSFTIEILDKNSFKLSKFKREGKKVDYSEVVPGKFDQMIRTPLGKVGIIKTPGFRHLELPATIKFSYSDVYSTALAYCKKVKTEVPSNKANVIEISIKDVSKQRGDDIIKKIIDVYNRNWIADKNQISTSTSKFIDERLAVIESELGNVDSDISSFKSSNLLPDLTQSSSMYMQQASAANAKILELSNMCYMAKYVKNLVDNLTPQQLIPTNSGFEDQVLAQQIANYNTKVIERNNLAGVSSPNNPVVKDMDAALLDMRNAIRAAISNSIVGLEQQIKSQERYEGQAVDKIASNPKQAKYLLSVERQQKVKESLYLYLLQKREENELSQSFAAYNTRIIQEPNGSKLPVSPKRGIIYLLSFIVGICIPYTIIVIRSLLNNTVQSAKDFENIKIPKIAEIPIQIVHHKRAFLSKFIPGLKKDVSEEARVVVNKDNRNVINEAFRIARTNIDMMLGRKSTHNVIMTTSFNPGSGKSFISMNLAMVCSFKGKKVAVVDCDMRHGSVSEYVNSPKLGLSEYLSEAIDDHQSIIYPYPGLENISVVPIGKTPPNPTELLESERMTQLIEHMREDYDYVFLDCPPFSLVADTQIIEDMADLTIFVVRIGLLEKEMLPNLEKLYNDKTFKRMTLAINGLEMQKSSYYHYGKGASYYGA